MKSNLIRAMAETEAERGDHRAAYQHQVQYHQAREQHGRVRDAELARTQIERLALGTIAGLVIVSLDLLYARYRLITNRKPASARRLKRWPRRWSVSTR